MSAPQALGRGQNAPLATTTVVLTVDVAAAADLSALLVTGSGKVRSDADFVFYNQPTGPGVRLLRDPWRLQVDLDAVPADVEQVRAIVTLDDATGRFGALRPARPRPGVPGENVEMRPRPGGREPFEEKRRRHRTGL